MDISKIINKIAQNLDCGLDSYFNSKTNELISIPSLEGGFDENELEEAFGEDLKKVKKNRADFTKIEVLPSSESFRIMERFVDQLTDKKLKRELEQALEQRKPFQKFKFTVENSDSLQA
jgi:acetylornithine deacetylase/succinyl-diaminopimelate desuccinylase-like protein